MNTAQIVIPVLIIITGLVLTWLEWKASKGVRGIIRICATLLALCSIYFLWTSEFSADQEVRTAVIATEGHDSLQFSNYSRIYGSKNVYHEYANAYSLPDMNNYDSLLILGHGPKATDMLTAGEYSVRWERPAIPAGITELSMPERVTVNRPFSIDGRINGHGAQVILTRDGYKPDTLPVDQGSFNTITRLKIPGAQLIGLEVIDSLGQPLSREQADVVGEPAMPLRFIILQSFPTPEIRFLKENLSSDGHSIISRTAVSRGTYVWEYLNTQPTKDIWSALDEANMLIIDAGSLRSLTRTRQQLLNNAVENGLGVFISSMESPSESILPGWILPEIVPIQAGSEEFGNTSIETLSYRFKNGLMNGLIGVARVGKGKISSSALGDTYPLLLNSDSIAYRNIWAEVIYHTGRETTRLAFSFPPAYQRSADKVMPFSLNSTSIPDIFVDGVAVPVGQNLAEPERWDTQYWPKRSGWHDVLARAEADTISSQFYVPDSGEWQAARATELQQNVNHYLVSPEAIKRAQPHKRYLPFVWLCLLFISLGYLWLEPRL